MTSLLPNARQQFLDGNGKPLAGGSVLFLIPNTETLKPTWADPLQAIPNLNPVVLDGNGEATIYGSGQYRQILSDINGVQVWDGQTADLAGVIPLIFAGTSFGVADAQRLTPSIAIAEVLPGQAFSFFAGIENVGSTTLQIGSTPALPLRENALAGPVHLTGGELQVGNQYFATLDPTGAYYILQYGYSAQNVAYTAPWPGAQPRNQQSVNAQWFCLYDFMSLTQLEDALAQTGLVDQSSAYSAFTAGMAAFAGGSVGNDTINVMGLVPGGKYLITETALFAMPGSYGIWEYGANYDCQISAAPFISHPSSPTVPTAADADGQTAGACFADPSPTSYTGGGGLQFIWRYGGKISGARFGMVLRGAECNGFRWVDPEWDGCNVGFFNYAAMQDVEIINMRPEACSAAIISSATCFTADNAYWVYWTSAGNAQGSFWGNVTVRTESFEPRCVANPTWASWFSSSILRPTTVSASAVNFGGTGKEYGAQGYVTAVNADGRSIYAPGRDNGKNNKVNIETLHPILSPRGGVFLGGHIDIGLSWIDGEANFLDPTINAGPPFTESMITLWNSSTGTAEHVLQGGGLSSSVGPLATITVLDPGGITLLGEHITGLVKTFSNGSEIAPMAAWIDLVNYFDQSVASNQVPGPGIDNLARGQFGLSYTPNQIGSGSTFVLVTLGGAGPGSFAEDQLGTGGGVIPVALTRFSIPDLSTEPHALVLNIGTNAFTNGPLMGYLDVLLRHQDTGEMDSAQYLAVLGNQGISTNGFELGGDAGAAQPVIVANSTSIANFLCKGMPITVSDGANTDTSIVESFAGATITLQGDLTHAYAAATPTRITSPFTIQRTITAFVNSWVSIGDNAGRLEITNNEDPVRLDVWMKFQALGPQV